MESLETLGDSFIKYVTGQNLFNKYKHREDMLTSMREEKVSNPALCQLACKSEIVVLKIF
jgi:endoribonuclease Dicer